jgi:hypothetical protein
MAATEMAEEIKRGIDARIFNPNGVFDAERAAGADVHVVHTHLPDSFQNDGVPVVYVAHGTPETIINTTRTEYATGGYGHGDALMLLMHWLQTADAVVTHWERHAEIYRTLSDKGTRIDVVPMGIERDLWQPVTSLGKYAGTPSVFTAENQYQIKSNEKVYLIWPAIVRTLPAARLHAIYVPRDQWGWQMPLAHRTCGFTSYISDVVLDPAGLRNAFCSTDFYLSLIQNGDYGVTGMQAAACGGQVISYWGNPYSHYWLDEGDQRRIAAQLLAVLRGEVEPRTPLPVPTVAEMCDGYLEIYRRLGVLP